MPIYEYHCKECGNNFDELVRKSDDEPAQCKFCESAEIERVITAHGGYQGDLGGASTKPRGSGSFKR